MKQTFSPAGCRAALSALALLLPACAVLGQAAVLTQNNDNARTGTNALETALTPANVTVAGFGKLFTLKLNANVNGQVLYAPGLAIGGATHNALFAYTSDNNNGSPSGVYALDADAAGTPLWFHDFSPSAQWTTCTPAIDIATNTIYVLTKSTNDSGTNQIHALDLLSGAEKLGSPFAIAASFKGTGDGQMGGRVNFANSHANDRAGLLFQAGYLYCAFAHNSDSFPYQGWVLGYKYDGTKFQQTAVFCTTPNGGDGGVWMAGKGLATDAHGNIYCSVGNGTFDANTGGKDYGMCYIKLSTPSLSVYGWFAPFDEKNNSNADLDLGGAGLLEIPGTSRLFGGGTKFGSVFLLDSNYLGGFTPGGPDRVLNRLDSVTPNDSVGQNPIAWDAGAMKYIYLWAGGANIEQFQYDPTLKQQKSFGLYQPGPGALNPAGIYKQTSGLTSGGSLTVTANGSSSGILWAVGNDRVVHAFNALDISQPELWNSNQNAGRDSLGSVGHFQFPTAVNGKVYVPTGDGRIVVYGLLH